MPILEKFELLKKIRLEEIIRKECLLKPRSNPLEESRWSSTNKEVQKKSVWWRSSTEGKVRKEFDSWRNPIEGEVQKEFDFWRNSTEEKV
ncbi:hypothetical protein COCNU_05G003960 [Cocos nucifera]|uniref:Uncharacterized protein n=1 Tax=Cocos nucifera TaxID=13894 RepID=A0A8K0I7Y2_COCNU|nr:hypothetical protein COCNU_05G003960 [Cocos nucifera]